MEASCLISAAGGCVPLLAIVLHTESDKRVACVSVRGGRVQTEIACV